MFNVVELIADEQEKAPCIHGNIVTGHACYCHKDDWKEGPRKCPIYRNFGLSDLPRWHKREWPTHKLPMFKGFGKDANGEEIMLTKMEDRPYMPEEGGCPMFESNPEFKAAPLIDRTRTT